MGSISDHKLCNGDTLDPNKPRDVFFFPHTRTASHVLCRLLSKQPDWTQSNYHFFTAFNFARDKFGWDPRKFGTSKDRKDFENLLEKGFEEIQHDRKSAHTEVGYVC